MEEKKKEGSKKGFDEVMSKLGNLAKLYGPKVMDTAKVLAEDAKKGGRMGVEKIKELNLERQKLQTLVQLGKIIYQQYQKGDKLAVELTILCQKISQIEKEAGEHNEEAKKIGGTFKTFKRK